MRALISFVACGALACGGPLASSGGGGGAGPSDANGTGDGDDGGSEHAPSGRTEDARAGTSPGNDSEPTSSRDGALADAGSIDVTTPYQPCPSPPEPCKIMPSGDSITVGAQSTDTGGYRVPLFQITLDRKQNITFVGPSGAGPATVDGVAFPDAHDGHSGYIIDTIDTRKGLLPLMEQNLTKFTPHIVLLMIGTNDVNSQLELATAPARLAALMDIVTSTSPATLLAVAQLIPTRTDSLNVDVQAFNAAIPTLVAERARAGKHVLLVDMYHPFTADPNYRTALLFDGLHPNDAGYALMARTWYGSIGGFLH